MYSFINGEIDVLVSTTIIETGLDISNVNTMIIHDSDRYGLSQLYQLRGRIGRSNRTAYAFLMYRRNTMLKETAEKRLSAIREYTDLGSGFKIAMRDLELRGAGNLLGAEQHGHMNAVGYDLYCKMLSEAVKEAKDLTQGGEEYLACSAKVISAIEFIRNNYARQICLEDIAEYAGVSRVYLSQIFKKETGKNISDYLVEYRLGKAKELLLNSNLKIYTIAELCGFGSAQYFNKIFKKMNGISPYQLKDNKLQ